MENQPSQPSKKNSNVIYFLIVVVLALLATDVYLYLQKSKSDTRIVTETGEKTRLQSELDSLNQQLISANAGKAKLNSDMQARQDSLSSTIKSLQQRLAKGKLTQKELDDAREQINQLKYSVTSYEAQIADLKKKNQDLANERDTLKGNLAAANSHLATAAQTDSAQKKQLALQDAKIKAASAIKTATVQVTVIKLKHGFLSKNINEKQTNSASSAKKIKIDFTTALNDNAQKGSHDIYIRVIDPTGNLITDSNSGNFNADGQDFQYTYKSSIEFQNDNGVHYPIDWANPVAFQKGVYTIVLYADGYTMGKTSFELK